MQAIRPFFLPGDRARKAVLDKLYAASASWSTRWSPTAQLDWHFREASGVPAPEGNHAHYSDGIVQAWAVQGAATQAKASALLLGKAFAGPSTSTGDWAQSVVAAGLAALADVLVQALAVDGTMDSVGNIAVSPDLGLPGSGGIVARCAALDMELWVSSGVLRHVPPPDRMVSLSKVMPLAGALTVETAQLAAMVGSVELEVGRLMSLLPGDVLRLPITLDTPISLQTPDGLTLATCRLGARHGRRAVQVVR